MIPRQENQTRRWPDRRAELGRAFIVGSCIAAFGLLGPSCSRTPAGGDESASESAPESESASESEESAASEATSVGSESTATSVSSTESTDTSDGGSDLPEDDLYRGDDPSCGDGEAKAGVYCFEYADTPLPWGQLVLGRFTDPAVDQLGVYDGVGRELTVWRSDGGGVLTQAASYDFPPPWDSDDAAVGIGFAADVMGDDKDELLIGRAVGGTVLTLSLDSSAPTQAHLSQGLPVFANGLVPFEFSGDAKGDLVAFGDAPDVVSAWVSDGAGQFYESSGTTPAQLPCGAVEVARGNFADKDQLVVLTASCAGQPQPLRLIEAVGDDLIETPGPMIEEQVVGLAVGDLDGDGRDDLLSYSSYTGSLFVMSGEADGLAEPVEFPAALLCPLCPCVQCGLLRSLEIGNLDGSPEADLAVSIISPDGQRIIVGLNPGAPTETWYELDADGDALALIDLDADGLDDMLLRRGNGFEALMSQP